MSTALILCKQGGWQSLTNAQGQPFANQGQCISSFIHHPVTIAALAGSFTGTTTFSLGNGGCSFVEQAFDATYPGVSAVGSVSLHVDGCIVLGMFPQISYSGAFVIVTSVGTLNGNVVGPISNVPVSPPLPGDFDLALTILSGTGAFAGAIGTIDMSVLWPPPYGTQIFGSVAVP